MQRRDFLISASVVAASAVASPSAGGFAPAPSAATRRLSVFNSVSLDGFFTDASGDMSWARSRDPEWTGFQGENAGGEAEMLFGRKTYDMMASFWPSPQAMQSMPAVAEGMNRMRKTVFSHTLDKAAWQNTRVIKGDLATEVRRLKSEPGPLMVILGSGQIVAQLTEAGLIDEYQLAVVPIVLGAGRTLFEGVTTRPRLRLMKSRAFGNGNVMSWYEPV
jgi:dihydrofolate reductase